MQKAFALELFQNFFFLNKHKGRRVEISGGHTDYYKQRASLRPHACVECLSRPPSPETVNLVNFERLITSLSQISHG